MGLRPSRPVQVQFTDPESDNIKSRPLRELVERYCPSLFTNFEPPWYLNNGHLQTLYSVFGDFTKVDQVLYSRTYLRLVDGGTIGLDFVDSDDPDVPEETPVVVVSHGLTGGSYESYVRAVLSRATRPQKEGGLGYRAVVMNYRGCAGVPLTSGQFYSAGYTDDLRTSLIYIKNKFPNAPLLGVGFSLGANVITRYVAEEKDDCLLSAACALGCPWDLQANCNHIETHIFNRIVYSKGMARNLTNLLRRHSSNLRAVSPPWLIEAMDKTFALRNASLIDFDNAFTCKGGGAAPVFPLASAEDYYVWASSHKVLPEVRKPLLIINSLDDPVVREHPAQKNPWTVTVNTAGGGHLGWFQPNGAHFKRWTTGPVLEWMQMIVEHFPISQKTRNLRTNEKGFLVDPVHPHLGSIVIDKGQLFEGEEVQPTDLIQGL